MANSNTSRWVESLLARTQSLPPSFVVHLHPEHWLINNSSKFLYHNQTACILDDIRAHRIPADFLDIFESAKVPFYDGCMIVELFDYRPQRNKASSAERPECTRVVLHPNSETLWADICSLNVKHGGKWTDQDALEIEAKILMATAPPLCLDPDPHLTRIVNHISRATAPTVPNSLKRKAVALDPEDDENEKLRRAKIMAFANPSRLKLHNPNYHLLDIMQEKARTKTSAPLAPSSGPQYLSQSQTQPHPGPVSVPAPPPQLKAASPAAPTPGDTTSTPQPTKVTTPQVPYTTSAYVQSSPMPPPQPTTNQFIHQHPQMSPPLLPTAPQQVYTNQVPSEIARRTPTPAQHLPATVAPARSPSRHYAHTLLQPIPRLPQSHGSPQSNAHPPPPPPPPPPPLMPQAATPVSHQPSSHPQHHIQQPHLPQQPTRPPSVRSSRTPIPQHHLSQHSMQPPQTRTPVQPPSSQHHSPITNISQHPSPSHQQQPVIVQGHRPPSRLQQTPITSHVHAHATTPRSRPMQGSPSPLHTQQKLGSQHHALSPPPIPIVRTGGIKREGTPQPYIVSPKSGSVSVPSRTVRTPVPSQQQQGVIVGGGIQPTPVVGRATLSQVSQNVNVQSQAQGLMGPYQGQQAQLHSHVPNDPAMVVRMKTGGGSVQGGQGTIQSQNPMSVQSQQQQQLQQLMYQKALMAKNGRTGTPGIGQQQQQLPPGMMRVNPMIMNAAVRSGTGQQQQQGQGGNGYSQQQLMALQQQFLRAQAAQTAQAQVRGLNMDQMKVLQAQVHAQQAQLAQQHHHHQQQQQQLFLQQQQQHHSVIQSNTQQQVSTQQRGGRTGTPGNNLSSNQQQQQQYYFQQIGYNINMQNAQVASAAAAAVAARYHGWPAGRMMIPQGQATTGGGSGGGGGNVPGQGQGQQIHIVQEMGKGGGAGGTGR